MRIGIDAKWYFKGPPSGVNVVRNIVDTLIDINEIHHLVIFLNSNSKGDKEDFIIKNKGNNKISIVFIPGKFNFITNLFIFPFYSYKLNLDIILFQNYVPYFRLGKTKYFNFVHDFLFLDYPIFFSKIEKYIYQFIVSSVLRAHHIITISNSEKKRILIHTNIDNTKVSVVHHGIDDQFYKRSSYLILNIKEKYNLPSRFILYVGRINIRKNISSLLISFSKLKIDRDISLVIVGKDENCGFDYPKLIKELNIEKRVCKIGHVSDEDLGCIFSAAEIFVSPSFAEGFGLPPLEAMKSGIPAIVSRIAPHIEVCGDSSLYFNPLNIVELESKISRLLIDKNLYNKLKQKGLKRSNQFTWKISAKNLLNVIENN